MFHTQPISDITMRQLGRSLGLCVAWSTRSPDWGMLRRSRRVLIFLYNLKIIVPHTTQQQMPWKMVCIICSLWSHLNVLTFPPPDWGMLRRSRRVLIFLETLKMFHTQPSSDITIRQLARSLGLCVTPYPVEPYSCYYLCGHTTYQYN